MGSCGSLSTSRIRKGMVCINAGVCQRVDVANPLISGVVSDDVALRRCASPSFYEERYMTTRQAMIRLTMVPMLGAYSLFGGQPASAQFVQPLTPPSANFCINYSVANRTHYSVQIRFDNLDSDDYQLQPGRSVVYHKVNYCGAPAYVVASYGGPNGPRPIVRNMALDKRTPNFDVVESGMYVLINPSGTAVSDLRR
jgi:hypothetical protein